MQDLYLCKQEPKQLCPVKGNALISSDSVNYQRASQFKAVHNIAFHGLFGVDKNRKATPEEKLNAAIQCLDDKSIVIFAQDFENAKALLTNQIQYIKFPLQNIYYVQNSFNNGSFAVYRDYKDNRKLKLFKLHPLEAVQIFEENPKTTDKRINYHYAYQADEPIELKNKQYISFGPYKKETVIKTDFENTSKRFIFENEVEKYNYLQNDADIIKYNKTRLASLKQNTGKKTLQLQKIMFSDIGAQDENIKALEQNVIFPVMYPDFYKGFRINKGILLYGPPRCGKTMLALALANELGVNFVKLGANDLTHSHMGKTEENWRNLFKQAIENQPTIIFIDEIDKIIGKAGGSNNQDVSREGVQRDILPIVEGSTVATKYGNVKTCGRKEKIRAQRQCDTRFRISVRRRGAAPRKEGQKARRGRAFLQKASQKERGRLYREPAHVHTQKFARMDHADHHRRHHRPGDHAHE